MKQETPGASLGIPVLQGREEVKDATRTLATRHRGYTPADEVRLLVSGVIQ